MAQTCYNGVNNILVYNSGNDSKGMTAGVKYLFYLCNYIKKTSKYLETTETLPMVPLGTLMLKTQSGSEKSPSMWSVAECSCASVVVDAESEKWGGCHAAPGPAGGAVLRVAAAAV